MDGDAAKQKEEADAARRAAAAKSGAALGAFTHSHVPTCNSSSLRHTAAAARQLKCQLSLALAGAAVAIVFAVSYAGHESSRLKEAEDRLKEAEASKTAAAATYKNATAVRQAAEGKVADMRRSLMELTMRLKAEEVSGGHHDEDAAQGGGGEWWSS